MKRTVRSAASWRTHAAAEILTTRGTTTMAMKITEIKVTAGKEVFIFQPKSCLVVTSGKSREIPEKLATQLFKAVSGPAEKLCDELKNFKE